MADYIADNPQFVVNGFRCAVISGVLDGLEADKKNLDVSEDNFSEKVERFFSSDSDYYAYS